eukprot:gene1006-1276_t
MAGDFDCDDLSSLLALICDLTTSYYPINNQQSPITINNSTEFSPSLESIFSRFLPNSMMAYHCGFNRSQEDEVELTNTSETNEILENYKIISSHISKTDSVLEIEKQYNYISELVKNKQLESLVTVYNIDFSTFTLDSNNDLFQHQFDKIVSIEGVDSYNGGDMDPITSNNNIPLERTQNFLNQCKLLLKPNVNSKIILQTISGPYHPYQEIDLKPERKPTLKNKIYQYCDYFEKKYLTKLENDIDTRYIKLMKILSKGFINGHIYDYSSEYIPNYASDLTAILSTDKQFNLLEMENIGDFYPEILKGWCKELLNNYQSSIGHPDGATLENLEIQRGIIFNLSYLISCFKSVWSNTES